MLLISFNVYLYLLFLFLSPFFSLSFSPASFLLCSLLLLAGGWRRWHEGEVMVFDDSFEHEVINDTSLPRIVLLIRFWHPQLNNENVRAMALANTQVAIEQGKVLRVCPPLRSSFLDQWAHGDYSSLANTERVKCPKCKQAAPMRFVTTASVLDEDDGIRAECSKCKFTSGSSAASTSSSSTSSQTAVKTSTSSCASTVTTKAKATTATATKNITTTAAITATNPAQVKSTLKGSKPTSSSVTVHVLPDSSSSVDNSPTSSKAVDEKEPQTEQKNQALGNLNTNNLSPEMFAKLQLAQELIKKSGLPIKLVEMPTKPP